MQQSIFEVLGAFIFLCGLSVYDIRSMRLPNRGTFAFLIWELIAAGVSGVLTSQELWLCILFALLWGVLALALGMGGGDFKLLFPLALLVRSLTDFFFVLSSAAALGAAFSLARRYRLTRAVPFAPFLAISTLVALFF